MAWILTWPNINLADRHGPIPYGGLTWVGPPRLDQARLVPGQAGPPYFCKKLYLKNNQKASKIGFSALKLLKITKKKNYRNFLKIINHPTRGKKKKSTNKTNTDFYKSSFILLRNPDLLYADYE